MRRSSRRRDCDGGWYDGRRTVRRSGGGTSAPIPDQAPGGPRARLRSGHSEGHRYLLSARGAPAEGGQDYDVIGSAYGRLTGEILDQYERHLGVCPHPTGHGWALRGRDIRRRARSPRDRQSPGPIDGRLVVVEGRDGPYDQGRARREGWSAPADGRPKGLAMTTSHNPGPNDHDALSPWERQVLAGIEHDLAASDPRLADEMSNRGGAFGGGLCPAPRPFSWSSGWSFSSWSARCCLHRRGQCSELSPHSS